MSRSSTRLSTRFSFSFFTQSWEARWWISCAAGETSSFSVFINHELDWPVLWVNCALFSCSDTRKCILKVAPWNLTQFAQIEKIRRVNPVSFITLADREGQVSEFYFGSSLNSWVPPSKFNLAVSLHISTPHTRNVYLAQIHIIPRQAILTTNCSNSLWKKYKTLSISGTRMVFQQPARGKPWFSEEEDFFPDFSFVRIVLRKRNTQKYWLSSSEYGARIYRNIVLIL